MRVDGVGLAAPQVGAEASRRYQVGPETYRLNPKIIAWSYEQTGTEGLYTG